MALKTKLKVKSKAPAAPKPLQLTLEEIREKYDPGSFELAVAELKELARRSNDAREYVNATNRQQTVTKKAVKAYVDKEELKPEDEIQVGEIAYRYDVTYAEKIDPAQLYAKVKAGKITEDQFFNVISVLKGPAGLLIGAHVLNDMIETVPGKEFDIRKRELDKPVEAPVVVRKNTPPQPKSKLKRDIEQAPAKIGGSTKLRKLRKLTTR